jgi:hypothetical protein
MKLTVPLGRVLRITSWVAVIALVSGLALGGAVGGGPPSPRPSASATTSGCS